MPERRVRGGHVIEAINLAHLLFERPARDEPHDHLDALGPGLAHVLDERNLACDLRIAGEAVEKALVPFRVDEARTHTLKLVRHAAGAEDDDAQLFFPRLHGALERFAEVVAAI